MIDTITIKGARENNLKNIDLEIPKNKLVVMTGVSGSGKSSLAFDTIFAEGQRRYIESLSSYARQFLGQMDKPDVDSITGLSPAISIDQKSVNKNPRSTVGTVTEIYDYLRLLYARIGIPHCPVCGIPIKQQTISQITDDILELPVDTKIMLLAPIARGRKGEFKQELEQIKKSGFVRVRIDGIIYDLSEQIKLDKNKKHNIDIVADRLVIKDNDTLRNRITDSLEVVFSKSEGLLTVVIMGEPEEERLYSLNFACPEHGISIGELTPKMFSFNNPYGACEKCTGLGIVLEIEPESLIPNPNLTIAQGAIHAMGWNTLDDNSIAMMYYKGIAKKYSKGDYGRPQFENILKVPVKNLPKEILDVFLYGTKGEKLEMDVPKYFGGGVRRQAFEGVINNLNRRYKETQSDFSKDEIMGHMTEKVCSECGGHRLKREVLAVTVKDINISELTNKSVLDCIEFFKNINLTEREIVIAERILKEIRGRLTFLKDVGVGYLTLARNVATLSGGESQRLRLATQIGSGLTNVLYVLDEPSIGLHQKDAEKLINALKNLRDIGNTVVVVEHDEETMVNSDYIVELGPFAGARGGEIIYSGDIPGILKCKESITGQYLKDKNKIPYSGIFREGNGKFLEISDACNNNLKNVNVKIPLGTLTCIAGVSGSGKSTLLSYITNSEIHRGEISYKGKGGKISAPTGSIEKLITIDQAPIGKSSRSNPLTYVGVFDSIRELFASTNESKARGYKVGRFSFNVKGGRCEACAGDGYVKLEMFFLPDVYVPCEVCKGERYSRETLEVRYNGKNVADILNMTIDELVEFFKNVPKISKKLLALQAVGLGYIKGGQRANTLSGGEAQRVKLATELCKFSTSLSEQEFVDSKYKSNLYILDEPTTGLHSADVKELITVLQNLVNRGNTVVIIEHNVHMIKISDHIIDLGPEGGDNGGEIVAQGTPEDLARNPKPTSPTSLTLSEFLEYDKPKKKTTPKKNKK